MIAALVIVAVVVFVARGYGGELSTERGDYLELELGPVSATDVVLLRPPLTLAGYSMPATDEALERIAASIRERDVRIVALEQLVTDLTSEPAALPLSSPYGTARHRRTPFETAPFESGPFEPAPFAPAPSEPAPFESAPFEPAPFESAPPPEQSHD